MLKKCIILVGCMGCGKTTIGQELHKETGLPFMDTDAFIEQSEGMTISEIFAQHGESYFRALETNVLKTLSQSALPDGSIISTGGGIVLKPENRELLRKLGFVVWLNPSIETIIRRIGKSKDRPLIQTADPAARLRAILDERRAIYEECADLIIDTTPLTPPEVAFGIIESARHSFSQRED